MVVLEGGGVLSSGYCLTFHIQLCMDVYCDCRDVLDTALNLGTVALLYIGLCLFVVILSPINI